jgi:SAM-dependent methyltransferase
VTAPSPTRGFFAGVADTWVDRYAARPSFRERLTVIADVVEPILAGTPDPAVLDFGGGPGVFSLLCAARAGFVVNLDPSLEMVRAGAAAEADIAGIVAPVAPVALGRVRHVAGPLDVLSPAVTRRFDLILAIAVLEYLARPDLAVARLAELLTVGGRLVLTVPRPASPMRRVERLLAPVTSAIGGRAAAPRLTDRTYTTLRPHGDRVAWLPAGATNPLKIESERPLALGPRAPRSWIRPNTVIVARRTGS